MLALDTIKPVGHGLSNLVDRMGEGAYFTALSVRPASIGHLSRYWYIEGSIITVTPVDQ